MFSKMGSSNMFSEVKNICKSRHNDQTAVVDSAYGSQEISDHFKGLYEKLYNEQEGMSESTIVRINNKVDENESRKIITQFTGKLVKAAVHKLKNDKVDVFGIFTSDC